MTTETTTTLLPTGTWNIDPSHTNIGAVARHLGFSKVRGSFKGFEGSIVVGDSLADSSVSLTIDAASIDTGVADRDSHLRSGDFLDVENHPTVEFVSTEVREAGAGYEVLGDLTMRGVTQPITLDMEFLGLMADPWGNEKAIFTATTGLERERWGLTWNAALESGGLLVSKTFKIELEVQAAR